MGMFRFTFTLTGESRLDRVRVSRVVSVAYPPVLNRATAESGIAEGPS